MIRRTILIFVLGLMSVVISARAEATKCRELTEFQGYGECSSVDELITKVGKSDSDIGSGIHVLVYQLCNGSNVIVGTPDMKHLFYIKHRASGQPDEDLLPKQVVREERSGKEMFSYNTKCISSGVKEIGRTTKRGTGHTRVN